MAFVLEKIELTNKAARAIQQMTKNSGELP